MKISPIISSTPTMPPISNLAGIGLSPERRQVITRIAEGGLEKAEPEATQQIALETKAPVTQTSEIDTSVQTNVVPEASGALSPQLAAIARQRRALQLKERGLEEREKSLSGQPTVADLKKRAQSNALGVLQELEISYDKLTNELLAAQTQTNPQENFEVKLKALDDKFNKTLADREVAQERAVLKQILRNVQTLSANDDYELIRASHSEEDVLEHIYDHYLKTGNVLDEDVAMKFIEDKLYSEAKALAKIKKMQGILTPPEPAAAPAIEEPGIKTLTNKDSARPTLSRRQRAINAMLGQK